MSQNDTQTVLCPLLAAALLKAQQEVESARKDSKNKFHGYKYASAEVLIEVGSDALHSNGLTLSEQSATFEPFPAAMGGAVGVVRAIYLLQHQSGEYRLVNTDVPVCPEEGKTSGWSRPLDKALFGSRTEGLGYVLRGLLLIKREDENDVSGRADAPPRREDARPAEAAPSAVKPQPESAEQHLKAILEAVDMTAASIALTRARAAGDDGEASEAAFVERVRAELEKSTANEKTIEAMASYLARAALRRGGKPDQDAREAMRAARARAASPV